VLTLHAALLCYGTAAFYANYSRGYRMINAAVTFLIIAIIAAVLGFSGIAGAATNIAWIVFVAGLVLAALSFVKRA
jgi:uncharacterized membrane protein YtjA (UPF0391 family)